MTTTAPFSIIMGSSDYRCASDWRGEIAYDDYHRVYLCLEGKGQVYLGKEWINLRGSRLYFIPGYRPFHHRCDHSLRLRWFHWRSNDPLIEADLASINTIVSWPSSKWLAWDPLCRRIDELIESPSPELNYRFQAFLMLMLAELETAPRKTEPHPARQTDLQRLAPAVEFMDQHFLENPSLSLVAAQAHLSLVHFHRLFAKHYRISPHRYMLRQRMEKAYHLLLRGGCSAKEASDAVGYSSYAYFSRAFRAYYRRCPADVLAGRVLPTP